jgi:hypothetical protein
MDIRDIMNDPNTPVWDMLADAGIDLDDVTVTPAGEWNVISDDRRIAFGDATTETGDTAEGWDWTTYELIDGAWEFAGQDYAETDEQLLHAIKAAVA